MTLGSPSIKRESTLWTKARVEGYLTVAAIGVLAGIVVAYARMPLHLPGHKALWWIPPVLAARLLTHRRLGMTVGAAATILTTVSLGGRLGGGVIAMPLVILAGAMLDAVTGHVERNPVWKWQALLLLASAAAVANFICFIKRLFEPVGPFFSTANLADLSRAIGCYLVFGFLAGTLGTAIAAFVSRRVRRDVFDVC